MTLEQNREPSRDTDTARLGTLSRPVRSFSIPYHWLSSPNLVCATGVAETRHWGRDSISVEKELLVCVGVDPKPQPAS